MGTSCTVEVSSDRLTSCPEGGENNLSAKRQGNWRLVLTLWPEKDKTFVFSIVFDIFTHKRYMSVLLLDSFTIFIDGVVFPQIEILRFSTILHQYM